MTMYRRFCCNDLLRLGTIDIKPHNTTDTMFDFMIHLGRWPANCLVAYSSGGQMLGYIFGRIEGTGLDCHGRVSMLSLSFLDLNTTMIQLLEKSCQKIYNARTMKKLLPANETDTIIECKEIGYYTFKYHDSMLGDQVEMRKPLRD